MTILHPNFITIVEYQYGSAVESIKPLLPLNYSVKTDPPLSYLVRTLHTVYSSEESTDAKSSYLDTLKNIAKQSGRSFSDILHEELSQISYLLDPVDGSIISILSV